MLFSHEYLVHFTLCTQGIQHPSLYPMRSPHFHPVLPILIYTLLIECIPSHILGYLLVPKSGSFTIGDEHDGTLSIEVNQEGNAFTAQLVGTQVNVSSVNDTTDIGTIVVKRSAGKNYTAPANVSVTVTAQFISNTLATSL